MKRLSLLMMCVLWTFSAFCEDKTVELTLTVGASHTIAPHAECGFRNIYVKGSYDPKYVTNGMLYAGAVDGSYYVSDDEAFSIVPHKYTASGSGTNTLYYYTYTLTPQKTGFYTFQQEVFYYVSNNYSGHSTATFNITVVDVTSVGIPSNLSLSLSDTYTFSPVISHPNATTTLIWQSSNTAVATINADGVLTTTGVGTTTITCTAHNGVSAQCEVTVSPVPVSSITLSDTERGMVVGENVQLSATVLPENASDKGVTWSSTDESVAVVSDNGLVTAVASGTCQIKATANDGSGKTGSCLVTVEKNNKLTVTSVTQCNGGSGTMNVLLTDEETILGFQFDLQLPAGVTIPTDTNGRLQASLTGNAVNTHSISSNTLSDGLYRFIVTSSSGKAISNANGGGLSITYQVADDMAAGTYDLTIKNIEMIVKKSGGVYEDVHPRDNTATLTVTQAVLGDVNGDGRISVMDVISIIGYIQEEMPARFIRASADVNGDGRVSITDAVQVIDMILNNQ